MSGYRPIYKRIWKDPNFQELSPEDKLLFLYFCTNEATNESGIYPLTPKTAATETGIPLATVAERFTNGLPTDNKGIFNGCIKNIYYDKENKLIFVKNLRKYNTGGRSDLIFKAVTNEYNQYKGSILWDLFFEEYPSFSDLSNGSPTVVKPLSNHLTTVLYDNLNDKDNDNDNNNDNLVGKENEIRRVVMSKVKELRGYDTRSRGAEINAINEMMKEGFDAEKIIKAYIIMLKQPFYQDKCLTLNSVYKNIHEVLKHGDKQPIKHQSDIEIL